MKYTIQLWTESGNYAAPEGTDVKHVNSREDIRWHLANWQDEVHRYDEAECGALVWFGHHDDVTDMQPEKEATLGKRGGLSLF